MKKIYRTPSDLSSVPNGMWKMYALDLLKHGPIEADLETGSVCQANAEKFWYESGNLHKGTGQQANEVLVPTEVIDPMPVAQPAQQVYVHRHGHAIPVEAVLEARSELNVGEDAWRRRATINLLNARRRKGRNLTEAEIHEITRRTR